MFFNRKPYTFGYRNTQILSEYFGETLFTLLDVAPKVINRIGYFFVLREAVMLLLKTGITTLNFQSYVFRYLLNKNF